MTADAPRALWVLTQPGLVLARLLARDEDVIHVPQRLHGEGGPDSLPRVVSFGMLGPAVAEAFWNYEAHVFVAATGIVVRTIAPLLQDKRTDPAVVVLDQSGHFVISLLSGHMGGANALAHELAARCGGTAVITTATDSAGRMGTDELARIHDCAVIHFGAIREVNRVLAEGGEVGLVDAWGLLPLPPAGYAAVDATTARTLQRAVWVDDHIHDIPPAHVGLIPRRLCVGVGCRRDTPTQQIVDHVREVFALHRLDTRAICSFATAHAKRDEDGLHEAASAFGLRLKVLDHNALDGVDPALLSPSAAARHVGVQGVAEPAALVCAGGGELIIPKQASERVTVAVARLAAEDGTCLRS